MLRITFRRSPSIRAASGLWSSSQQRSKTEILLRHRHASVSSKSYRICKINGSTRISRNGHPRLFATEVRTTESSTYRICKNNGSIRISRNGHPRFFATEVRTTESSTESPTSKLNENIEPMELHHLYRYLNLETFSKTELLQAFERIQRFPGPNEDPTVIDISQIEQFLLERFVELEEESDASNLENADEIRREYAATLAERILQVFAEENDDSSENDTATTNTSISQTDFIDIIQAKASQVDWRRTFPITASMLLVGASVGVITPAMPFVVESLGLTPGQYGMVVSAFGLAKMTGNIPAAIATERHGRKPYMTYSLLLIAAGVGGIGMAGTFEELYLCRLFTGFGVAALSTAGTMMITDLSTPLNRASTMAPIMSAFAAGTALGPALGGILVDQVGLHPTFYLVGVSYFGMAAFNRTFLKETKSYAVRFPWQQKLPKQISSGETLSSSIQSALGQWVPLLKDPKIRNVLTMNAMYWVALAGAQITLLPLILTDVDGLAMSATQLGSVYMGMSLVQIFGNPIFAKGIDRIGKAPAIVAGCTLISSSMFALPFCEDVTQLAAALGIWSTGSSMLSTAPLAYVSDRVDDAKRAQAIALLRTCGDVGFLVGASGTGALADWAGSLDVAMHTSAGLLLTATAWFATRQLLTRQISSANTTPTKQS